MLIHVIVVILFFIALCYIIQATTPSPSKYFYIYISNYVTSRWDNLYITEKAIYNYDINILINTYRNNMDRTWVVLLFTIIFLLTELIGHVGLLINESKISLLKERIKERRRNI